MSYPSSPANMLTVITEETASHSRLPPRLLASSISMLLIISRVSSSCRTSFSEAVMESLSTYPRRIWALARRAPLQWSPVPTDGVSCDWSTPENWRQPKREKKSGKNRRPLSAGRFRGCQKDARAWPIGWGAARNAACTRPIDCTESLISSATNGSQRSWVWESGAKSPSPKVNIADDEPRSRTRRRPRLSSTPAQPARYRRASSRGEGIQRAREAV